MSEKQKLLESMAITITDYREGEIVKPAPEHIDRWIRQFDADVQVPLLRELDHVLKKTYFKRDNVSGFLGNLVKNNKLAGTVPCEFWQSANFLNIQRNGHSQEEMLQIFGESLKTQCGLDLGHCGSSNGPYIYLDDVLFSGGRVGNDLSRWLVDDAPSKSIVHIVVIATHTFGQYKMPQRIKEEAATLKKEITLKIWRAVALENRNYYRNDSEVLWPAILPDDLQLQAYMVEEEKFPFRPRQVGGTFANKLFSSEAGRQLLERELLFAGLKIRSWCQNPRRAMRPLGFSAFGLGFGSTIVTFRNCPNNCPLALWWGDPDAGPSSPLSRWFPLFPRKTYDQEADFDEFIS